MLFCLRIIFIIIIPLFVTPSFANTCGLLFTNERAFFLSEGSSGNRVFIIRDQISSKEYIRKFYKDNNLRTNDLMGFSLLAKIVSLSPSKFSNIEISKIIKTYEKDYIDLTYRSGTVSLELLLERLYIEKMAPQARSVYIQNSELPRLNKPPAGLEKYLLENKVKIEAAKKNYSKFLVDLEVVLREMYARNELAKLEIQIQPWGANSSSLFVTYRLPNANKDAYLLIKPDNIAVTSSGKLVLFDPY